MIRIDVAILFCTVLCASPAAAAVTIATVPVENAGNTGELSGPAPGGQVESAVVGAVNYDFRIGKFEVTNSEYAEYLNAKAASDPLDLYDEQMGILGGGISRQGISGSYTYSPLGGFENKPVNFVSWYDALRFANWLHNGQGTGDTETGAYTLLGGTPVPSNGTSIVRNAGARWFLTNENEWYKAAYHKNDGVTGNYFDFPTATDTTPTPQAPPGDSNSANYLYSLLSPTDVGAYISSASPYGTFDQGGNVWEFTETVAERSLPIIRGGSFRDLIPTGMNSMGRYDVLTDGYWAFGFRVGTIPEPSAVILAIIATLGFYVRERRKKPSIK